MRPEFYVYCYPWDLEDEGLDASLGRLAGEIGVDGITVAAVLPEITQLRTMPPAAGRLFHAKAAAHFQPDSACYANTRIRPAPAAWMKSKNALERIVTAAEKQRLKVRALIHPLTGDALAERHPHSRVVNVNGDEVANALCPSNADVREYLAGLTRDLSTHYGIEAIELAGLGPPHIDIAANQSNFFFTLGMSEPSRELLSVCFCAACRQRAVEAGIDMKQTEIVVTRCIENLLTLPMPRDEDDRSIRPESEALKKYGAIRRSAIQQMTEYIRHEGKVPLYYHVPELRTEHDAAQDALTEETWDRLVVQSADDSHHTEKRIRRLPGQFAAAELSQPIVSAQSKDGPSLVALVHSSTQKGYAAINFETYGAVPAPCLDWVRQAIRYARRES